MWLTSPGNAAVMYYRDDGSGAAGRDWTCTCSDCDGLVGVWQCPGFYSTSKIVILSRFVALSVSLIQKVSLFQPLPSRPTTATTSHRSARTSSSTYASRTGRRTATSTRWTVSAATVGLVTFATTLTVRCCGRYDGTGLQRPRHQRHQGRPARRRPPVHRPLVHLHHDGLLRRRPPRRHLRDRHGRLLEHRQRAPNVLRPAGERRQEHPRQHRHVDAERPRPRHDLSGLLGRRHA